MHYPILYILYYTNATRYVIWHQLSTAQQVLTGLNIYCKNKVETFFFCFFSLMKSSFNCSCLLVIYLFVLLVLWIFLSKHVFLNSLAARS